MVNEQGRVKVLDFGLAKLIEPVSGEGAATQTAAIQTREGTILGTVSYMAPEQAEGKPVDQRADIFSFGAVLYEMLSGVQPFRRDSVVGTLAAIVRDEPPALDAARIPPAVRQVVKRALEKNPEARYASGGELVSALAPVSRAVAPRGAPNMRWLVAGAAAVRRGCRPRWMEPLQTEPGRLGSSRGPAGNRAAAGGRQGTGGVRSCTGGRSAHPGRPRISAGLGGSRPAPLVKTDPEGAEIYIRELGADEKPWRHVGTSPLKVPLPRGYFLWKAVKPGFAETTGAAPTWWSVVSLRLAPEGEVPDGMVLVPGADSLGGTIGIAPVEGPRDPYFIDRHEVTNRQFKQFVDQGGYQKREYWKTPFVKDGKPVSWEEAMAAFRDATGRPGPSTWEGGTYPTGKDDFPVTGVSWYEAAAYAAFTGKSLPTLSHWYLAADIRMTPLLIPASNFAGKGLASVGSYSSIGPFGTYDMAGNAQEWAWNEADSGFRFILGGAWSSPTYQFNQPDAKPPFDRGAANGFRCARYPTPPRESLLAPVRRTFRDYSLEKPVGDEAFRDHPQRLCVYPARVEGHRRRGRQQFSLLEEGKGQLLGGLRGRACAGVRVPSQERQAALSGTGLSPQCRSRVEYLRQHGGLQPNGIHHSQRPCGDLSDLPRDFRSPAPAGAVGRRGEGAPGQEIPGHAAVGRVPGEPRRHRRFETRLSGRELGSRLRRR